MIVPNKFPTLRIPQRIALVGEAPGADEERYGQPFVGASGRFLAALLSRAGVSRDACFLGNVSQHRPPTNDISKFAWDGEEVQSGLAQLDKDLSAFQPNIVILLGNTALKAAMDPHTVHKLEPRFFRFKNADWRGSVLDPVPTSPMRGRKCLPAFHPAYCLRDYASTPLLDFDLKRATRESFFPEIRRRERVIVVPATVESACTELIRIREARRLAGTDIEGYWNNLTSISFANDPLRAVVIPFVRKDGTRYWLPHEEPEIWRAVANTLEDPALPKVFQNGLYDRFALAYGHGIRVRNAREDTMLKWWELYAELPKGLDTQVSILIPDLPYYKGDRKSQDDATFFRYNGLDSCATLEIALTLDAVPAHDLPPVARAHYRFNNSMLNPLLYMELKGIRYDSLGAAQRRAVLQEQMYTAQAKLNGLAGRALPWTSLAEVRAAAEATMLTVKRDRPYKDKEEDWARFQSLLSAPNPTLATIGEVEDLVEASLNLSSDDQFIPFLYDEIKLPTQTKKNTKGEIVCTADYEALLKLSKSLQRAGGEESRLDIIRLAIEIRALETRQRMLGIQADPDGRIRCGYNIVGSDTGRVTCYTSPTGSGYNLQTIPNYTDKADSPGGVLGDRDLFLADEGWYFFECDLSGADGWTYAAYAAMLGDSTMLEDYLAGIAPFDVMTLKHRGIDVDFNDRKALKEAKKAHVKKTDWDRFAFKRVQHGAAYLEGGLTISNNILKDSEGKYFIEPSECTSFRDGIFFARYPGIRRWHGWVASRLSETPQLTAASGQVRKFFGRPDDILTKAVAFEPQANTTYATNLALRNLWTDPENRIPSSRDNSPTWSVATSMPLEGASGGRGHGLRIQPLHQVHDALCGQFRIEDTTWAVAKIKSYFDNTLTIAGQKITIPFDGSYGRSWGDKRVGTI